MVPVEMELVLICDMMILPPPVGNPCMVLTYIVGVDM
jgi:hypothetical protein